MPRPDVLTPIPAPSETLLKKRTPAGENPRRTAIDLTSLSSLGKIDVQSTISGEKATSGSAFSDNSRCISKCSSYCNSPTPQSKYKIDLGVPVVSSMATTMPMSGEFKSMNTNCEVSTCPCPGTDTSKKTVIDLTAPASGFGSLEVSSMKVKGEVSDAQGSQNSQCPECYSVGGCISISIVDATALSLSTQIPKENGGSFAPISISSLRQNERGGQKATDGRSHGLDRCC